MYILTIDKLKSRINLFVTKIKHRLYTWVSYMKMVKSSQFAADRELVREVGSEILMGSAGAF